MVFQYPGSGGVDSVQALHHRCSGESAEQQALHHRCSGESAELKKKRRRYLCNSVGALCLAACVWWVLSDSNTRPTD